MTTTRTVIFKSNNLGVDANLMLCFTPPSTELFKSQFPIAWRVTTLAAEGPSRMAATYENTLAFCVPQTESGNLIDASRYIPIQPGQSTILSAKPGTKPPVYQFSPPVSGSGTEVTVTNSLPQKIDIGVGFIKDFGGKHQDMNTMLLFRDVGETNSVKVEFRPVLSAYLSTGYQKDAILEGEIETLKALWSEDLVGLPSSSTWVVSRTSTGKFEIKRE